MRLTITYGVCISRVVMLVGAKYVIFACQTNKIVGVYSTLTVLSLCFMTKQKIIFYSVFMPRNQ